MGHAKEFLRCPRCGDKVWFIRHDHPTLTPLSKKAAESVVSAADWQIKTRLSAGSVVVSSPTAREPILRYR